MSSIYDWSLIAASNANSDASINWAEGQPPSTVNNSARAMMQRVKEFLNDLGGIATVTGTTNSLTLAAASGFTAYDDGLYVSFRVNAVNTSAVTLNVNSVGAKPLVKFTSSGEVALTGAELQAGAIYEAIYSEALSGATGAWLLLNPTPPATELPGFIKSFGGVNVPNGYLSCDGTAVSRTTYAQLFTAVGTAWGIGNGTTTFNVPDLRDDFVRGASPTLTVGTKQTDDIKAHTHVVTDPGHAHFQFNTPTYQTDNDRGTGSSLFSLDTFDTHATFPNFTGITIQNFGGTETRPRNGVVLFVIKT